MDRAFRLLGALLAALCFAGPAAAGPLIEADALATLLSTPKLVVLDMRPDRTEYEKGHIPGAIHSDYVRDGWRVTDGNGTPGMLPDPDDLEILLGNLGIANDSHVVVVAPGRSSADMSVATRVYWTFRVSGHDLVSVLDGGMAAWTAGGKRALEPGSRGGPATKFRVSRIDALSATKDNVSAALAAGTPLIDIRSSDQHLGINKAATVKRHGTLEGARNLPEQWLTVDNAGRFRSAAELKRLIRAAGIAEQGRAIAFCNTGQLATLGWFVLSEILGNSGVTVYDGSMAEWSAEPGLPMRVAIDPRAD